MSDKDNKPPEYESCLARLQFVRPPATAQPITAYLLWASPDDIKSDEELIVFGRFMRDLLIEARGDT